MTLNTLLTIYAGMEIQKGKDPRKKTPTWTEIYCDPYNYFINERHNQRD